MRRFAFVFWLLCFSLVRVYVCVWIHHLHTFVKAPIMMMICSLQWFYLDDLISLLSVGRRRRRRRKNLPFLLLTHPRAFLPLLLLLLLPWCCSHPCADKTVLSWLPAAMEWHSPSNSCHPLHHRHAHMHAPKHTPIFHALWKTLVLHNDTPRTQTHIDTR